MKKRQRSSWRRERLSICEQNQYCPDALYPTPGVSQYTGTACTGCNRYMARCSSSQPDFTNPHYLEPSSLRELTNAAGDDDTGNDPADEDYSITRHSDPGLLEGRQMKPSHHHKTSEFRDIRVFNENPNSGDIQSSNNQELQEQFAEILAVNDRKLSQSWSQRTDNFIDSDRTTEQAENFTQRFIKLWKEKYSNIFKFRFLVRTPNDFPIHEVNEPHDLVVSEIPEANCVISQIDEEDLGFCENYSELVNTEVDATQRNATRRKTCSASDVQGSSSKNTTLHKRVASTSSTETNLIEPAKVRIDAIRFFKKRKQNFEFDENMKRSCEDLTKEAEHVLGGEQQVNKGMSSHSFHSREDCDSHNEEESVEIVTRI